MIMMKMNTNNRCTLECMVASQEDRAASQGFQVDFQEGRAASQAVQAASREDRVDFRVIQADFQEDRVGFQAVQVVSQEDRVGFQAIQVASQEDRVATQAVQVATQVTPEDQGDHLAEARQEVRHHLRRQPMYRRSKQRPLQSIQAESADACTDLLIFG